VSHIEPSWALLCGWVGRGLGLGVIRQPQVPLRLPWFDLRQING